jgi:hypothetical protein
MQQLSYQLKTILLIHNSTSIVPAALAKIKNAAVSLVRTRSADQQFAIYTFSENSTLLQDFTSDTTELIQAIESIGPGQTGLSRWVDGYSISGATQGALIVLINSEDTQASSTLEAVLSARGSKRVFAVGIGNLISLSTLQQIGNAGVYPSSSVDSLSVRFRQIQGLLESFASGIYWLNYLSPKRGAGNHTLDVESAKIGCGILPPPLFQVDFNSAGFFSEFNGITVGATATAPAGVDTISVDTTGATVIAFSAPFPFPFAASR